MESDFQYDVTLSSFKMVDKTVISLKKCCHLIMNTKHLLGACPVQQHRQFWSYSTFVLVYYTHFNVDKLSVLKRR